MLLSLVSGIGPRTMQLLLDCFGSAEAILRARRGELMSVPGIGKELCDSIMAAEQQVDVEREWQLCCANHIVPLLSGTAAYPPLLTEIHDPPSVLYCQGTIEPRAFEREFRSKLP